MDSVISVIIGAIIFLGFTLGLAISINAVPIYLIVVFVMALLIYEAYEEIVDNFKLPWKKLFE